MQNGEASPRSRWSAVRGMAVPLQLGESAQEAELTKVLAIADASFLPRLITKGPQAASFLEAQGVTIPSDLLGVAPLESGGLIARTGGCEFFLEDGPNGNVVDRLETAIGTGPKGVYRVLRQDTALILSGAHVGKLFRHVCAYDFAGEAHRNLIFTQVAGVSCSVLRSELNAIPVFRLWTDGTYGIYIWRTLLEIAAELGGGAVGTAVFFPALLEARQP